MKNLKVFVASFILAVGFIACDSKTETTTEKETVIVEKEVEAAPAKKEEGLNIGVERDKNGDVGVKVEGKVD